MLYIFYNKQFSRTAAIFRVIADKTSSSNLRVADAAVSAWTSFLKILKRLFENNPAFSYKKFYNE